MKFLTAEKSLHNSSGFSLVEALIATVIVTAMMISGLTLIQGTGQGQIYVQRSTRASFLAFEKLEDLRVRHFTDSDLAATNNPCPGTLSNARPNPPESFDNGLVRRYFCVTDIGPAPAKAKQVDMYVQYDAFALTKTTKMSTIITRVQPWE